MRNKVYSCILGLRPPNQIYFGSRSPQELLKASGLTQVLLPPCPPHVSPSQMVWWRVPEWDGDGHGSRDGHGVGVAMGHKMAMGLEMDMVWGQPWDQGWSESRDGHVCGIEVAMEPRMAVWWLWDKRVAVGPGMAVGPEMVME